MELSGGDVERIELPTSVITFGEFYDLKQFSPDSHWLFVSRGLADHQVTELIDIANQKIQKTFLFFEPTEKESIHPYGFLNNETFLGCSDPAPLGASPNCWIGVYSFNGDLKKNILKSVSCPSASRIGSKNVYIGCLPGANYKGFYKMKKGVYVLEEIKKTKNILVVNEYSFEPHNPDEPLKYALWLTDINYEDSVLVEQATEAFPASLKSSGFWATFDW